MEKTNFRPLPLEQIWPMFTDSKKFVIGDYISNFYPNTKFDANPSTGKAFLGVVLEPRGVCMLKRAPRLLTIFWKSITWGTILERVDILKPGSNLSTHGLVAIDGTEIRRKNWG